VECGQPATTGPHCDTHKPRPDESRRASYRQAYRDPNYHRERQGALNRANGRCERCGSPGPLECDHIIALRDGGTNARANLIILCRPCHQAKTRNDRRNR